MKPQKRLFFINLLYVRRIILWMLIISQCCLIYGLCTPPFLPITLASCCAFDVVFGLPTESRFDQLKVWLLTKVTAILCSLELEIICCPCMCLSCKLPVCTCESILWEMCVNRMLCSTDCVMVL